MHSTVKLKVKAQQGNYEEPSKRKKSQVELIGLIRGIAGYLTKDFKLHIQITGDQRRFRNTANFRVQDSHQTKRDDRQLAPQVPRNPCPWPSPDDY